MVKYGMTPAQALRLANMIAAELLGMQDQIGSLEPGKFADVVALPADPLGGDHSAGARDLRDEGRRGV
jgi:imidazolonepropionase-like amidohydrolase